MNKEELIKVFENTEKIFETIENVSVTTKLNLSNLVEIKKSDTLVKISVINSDTVSAANVYSKLGKTGILNMASAKKAGGGVKNGARAQEESLFRCSNLFQSVIQEFYPIGLDQAIYTSDAIFIKDFNYNRIEPFMVDVVTIPALNLNDNAKYDDLDIVSSYEQITKSKIELMLNLLHFNKCENIVLGSWGSGVFKNDPFIMATYFYDVIKKYRYSFKNIVFAIINDHNSVSDNYLAYQEVFR